MPIRWPLVVHVRAKIRAISATWNVTIYSIIFAMQGGLYRSFDAVNDEFPGACAAWRQCLSDGPSSSMSGPKFAPFRPLGTSPFTALYLLCKVGCIAVSTLYLLCKVGCIAVS